MDLFIGTIVFGGEGQVLSKKSRLCYMLKEYNPSMHNFNVAIVDCNYMFQQLQSNHHQTVYQTCKKGIIVNVVSG